MYDESIKAINYIVNGATDFLEHMHINGGRYHYSYSGDIISENVDWGVGNTAFALKILYMLGANRDDTRVKLALTRICEFQQKSGFIFDPYIFRKSFTSNMITALKGKQYDNIFNSRYKRAESRQCHSAMLLFEKLPQTFPKELKINEMSCLRFLEKMDWGLPWAAGSHMSHLMFYLNLAERMKVITHDEFLKSRGSIYEWMRGIQDKQTGSWYKKDTTNQQKINGAMKVITGLYAAGITEFDYSKQLIDLCLDNINNEQACDNFNIIYVLHKASKNEPLYRCEEIRKFALDRLNIYMKYYHNDQKGFSFYEHATNVRYYGAKVSYGLDEADIHGTTLFLWGISIICQILGIDKEIGIREFQT